MNAEIDKLFGGRVRVRACGLCWENGKLLVANHKGLNKGDFWAPPGGGVEFAKPVEEVLKTEFRDETGLTIEPRGFSFILEFIREPLHAIEVYFDVEYVSGELKVGYDPEMSEMSQILTDTRFMPFSEIMNLPDHERHGVFRLFQTEKALKKATGFWKI